MRGIEIVAHYGPDTDVEVEAKRQLAELERHYRLEAQPFIDILAREGARKAPRIVLLHTPPEEFAKAAAGP